MPVNIGNRTTPYTISSNDLHFIGQADTVSSNGIGILNNANGSAELVVAGQIFTTLNGIVSFNDGDNFRISVTATGIVQSAPTAIAFTSSATGSNNSSLTNAGVVTSLTSSGVTVQQSDSVTILNSGTISGRIAGISQTFGADTLVVSNSGVISGGDGFNGNSTALNTHIVNTGTILGNNGTGAGDGFGVNWQGTGFTLENSGTVGGNVGAFSGSVNTDVIFNSGIMLGDVVMNNGNDVYRASGDGLVSGNIRGGGGNDDLRGASAADEMIGGNGNDKIKGRGGEDTLEGGNGRDIILGGDGDDEITGGNAGDLMLGGAGADVFLFTDTGDVGTTGATRDEIRDFEQGTDIINLAAMIGPEFLFAGSGSFSGGGDASIRLVEAGGNTFVQIDHDGDGTQDGRMLVRGVTDMTEVDFVL